MDEWMNAWWMQAAAGPCRAQTVQGIVMSCLPCWLHAARCTLDDALSMAVRSQVKSIPIVRASPW
jgi:hypothetical protein